MKIFLTGASGFIGHELIKELQSHNHSIIALSRSDTSSAKLEAQGCEVIRGDLENFESLQKGAMQSDGTIHLGFVPDYSNYGNACKIDLAAVSSMFEAIANTGKFFVYTVGSMGLKSDIGVQTTEETVPPLDQPGFGARSKTEVHVMKSAAELGIRSLLVRLPPTVHGEGDTAFIPTCIKTALRKKVSYYVGEGKNKWPAAHKKDVAVLLRLAAESGRPGRAYHASAELIEFKLIAEAIGEKFEVVTKSLTGDKVEDEFGFFGTVVQANMDLSSELTRKELGWVPKEIGLIDDIFTNYGNLKQSHILF